MPRKPFIGQKTQLSREQAIERYVLLRLRAADIMRLEFLVVGLHERTIQLPKNSPFTYGDLKDPIRAAFFGWFATLTDKDERTVYAFDPLYVLFSDKQTRIRKVQVECEACHGPLQQFRNNVAFHSRAKIGAQIRAPRAILQVDTLIDLEFARRNFHRLMVDLIAEELSVIPELPEKLAEFGLSHHPAFANLAGASGFGPKDQLGCAHEGRR